MKLTTTVLTKHNYVDHIKAIEKVLQKISEAVLMVNVENSFLDVQKLSTLVYGLLNMGQTNYFPK